jgi:hypothetical protein
MAGLLLKELKARGLVKRTLIVTPANLTFQWQRELKDKFREKFEVIRGDVLRANYGQNPWQERDQVITSVSWVSRVEDARESLLRSRWDLVIVDEAHKMSARSEDKDLRLPARRGALADDRPLPADDGHAAQGRPRELPPVPGLLDRDVYGSIQSLEQAMRERGPVLPAAHEGSAGHLPRPGDGRGPQALHQARSPHRAFDLDGDELDFYDELTRYVEDQSIKAPPRRIARAPGRRLHDGHAPAPHGVVVYAVRRSLERMRTSARRSSTTPRRTAASRSKAAAARRLRRPDRRRAAADHRPTRRTRCCRRSIRPPAREIGR